jgi:hypothetical protein
MQFKQVINTTPHDQDVYDDTGERIVLVLPKSDISARAGEQMVRLSDAVVDGVPIPVYGSAFGRGTGLPEPRDGVFYFVALPVALVMGKDRHDLLVCGPAVRDEKGRMIGCKGLSVPHHPVAALPEPRRFREGEVRTLIEQHTGGPIEGEGIFPYAELYRWLFDWGLISKEEMDLNRELIGDELWLAGD